jgi:pimeloyl-ACP methyl ester carboxylesterase
MRSTRRVRLFVVLLTVGLLEGVLAIAAPGLATATGIPKASWSSCFRDFGPTFQCTTVHVPLDYDGPNRGTISIAMVRLPAGDRAHRIGSLFINPGGPGGSGVDFALSAPFLFTQEVRDRFDIVGFDPRGIYRSTAFRCFGTPRQWSPIFTPFAFPITDAEEEQWAAGEHYLDAACAQRGGSIGSHMATADVARDLDRLRQAVGDQKLTYYGVSYGSYLGQTYANLFPNNFRALVIDGVLDPIAWSTGAPGEADIPFSVRLHSATAMQEELGEFFRLCDAGGSNCPIAPNSAARYAALANQLKAGPILILNPDTGQLEPFIYQDLIVNTLFAMYDSHSWPDLANFLAYIESQAGAATLGRALARLQQSVGLIPKRGFPHYPNFPESFPAVACADSVNPGSYADWSAAADAEDSTGYFGRIWTWVSSICADWPKTDPDRYMGPWNHGTAAPVLIVGNLFDGVTRYQGAQTAHALLPNSALLTVHGWAHTSLFLSACADQAIAAYLLSVTTPAPGTVCEQDFIPFAEPAAAAARATSTARATAGAILRAQTIPVRLIPRSH